MATNRNEVHTGKAGKAGKTRKTRGRGNKRERSQNDSPMIGTV